MSWRKDPLPYLVQFGVAHLPHGHEQQREVHLTLRAAIGGSERYLVGRLSA